MKQLQIVKTEPTPTTLLLMRTLGQGKEVTRFDLYADQDYIKLVEHIFSNDEVISWW